MSPRQPALLIVDHGSRLPEAHAHLERLAAEVQALAHGWRVRAAHMDAAAPSIAEGIDACVRDGATEVFVYPCFLAPGRHLGEDLPARVAEGAAAHPAVRVRTLRALGEAPGLAALIARDAVGQRG